MPWGKPGNTIPAWCAGCGKHGTEYVQRASLTPTFRARICPACSERGWRLTVANVEAGSFYPTGRPRAAHEVSAA